LQPRLCKPFTIKSVSREKSGFLISDGVVAIAARINARLVADLDPGILTMADIGLLAAVNPLRKGALQLLIYPKSTFRELNQIGDYCYLFLYKPRE
jgi:hypothetical protein